jgi:hypothetical protein
MFAESSGCSGWTCVLCAVLLIIGGIVQVMKNGGLTGNRDTFEERRLLMEQQEMRKRSRNQVLVGIAGALLKAFLGHRHHRY